MKKTLPINLVAEELPCLVIGGGEIAFRKVENLLVVNALVTVIAPELHEGLKNLIAAGKVTYLPRTYQEGDLKGFALVIAATDDELVNVSVFKEAKTLGILHNVVDDPQHCSFYFPSVNRFGELLFSISSSGTVPFAVKRFRKLFNTILSSPDWSEWWTQASRLREAVIRSSFTMSERNELFDRFFTRTVKSTGRISITPLTDKEFDKFTEKIEEGQS